MHLHVILIVRCQHLYMSSNQQSLLDFLRTLFSSLRDGMRASMPVTVEIVGREFNRAEDLDFRLWIRNDPITTMNPASRYGDDATGFLMGAEFNNPMSGDLRD